MTAPRAFHDAVRRRKTEIAATRDETERCDLADHDDDAGDELADREAR